MPDEILMHEEIDTQILIYYVMNAAAIFIAVTIHEFTKAFVSCKLGDEQPKKDGRLTLNPFKHFEPIGFLLMLFLGYGWGKPVRTSALYYKKRKRDTLLTYSMPIIIDFIFGIIFLTSFIFAEKVMGDNYYISMFLYACMTYSIKLGIFNLIPVYPMCGNKILGTLLDANKALVYNQYEKILQMILIILLVFPIIRNILDIIYAALVGGLSSFISLFI